MANLVAITRRLLLGSCAALLSIPAAAAFRKRGGIYIDPWIVLDGANAAPAGTAQYPTLLNSYGGTGTRVRVVGGSYAVAVAGRYQPPWRVAGVDYAVGCPYTAGSFPIGAHGAQQRVANAGNTAFSAEFLSYLSDHGWTLNTTPPWGFPVARFSSAINFVLDGWDCSGVAWWFDTTSNGVSFTNCLMGGLNSVTNWDISPTTTTTLMRPQGSVTLKYCTIDLGVTVNDKVTYNGQALSPISVGAGAETHVVEYNWFKNAKAQYLSFGGTNAKNITVKYNFFDEVFVGYGYGGIDVVSAASNGGPNNIRVTLSGAGISGVTTGNTMAIDGASIGGVNGVYTVTRISDTVYDLQGSTFTSTFTARVSAPGASTRGHMNWTQLNAGSSGITIDWSFNAGRQTASAGGQGPQFAVLFSSGVQNPITPTCTCNTMIALSAGAVSNWISGTTKAGSAATVTGAVVSPVSPPQIRVTVSPAADPLITTGNWAQLKNVGGVTNAIGRWLVTQITDNTVYDLQATNIGGQTFTSGGGMWDANTFLQGTSSLGNNFFDLTGAGAAYYSNPNWSDWGVAGPNINMTTGATIPLP